MFGPNLQSGAIEKLKSTYITFHAFGSLSGLVLKQTRQGEEAQQFHFTSLPQ